MDDSGREVRAAASLYCESFVGLAVDGGLEVSELPLLPLAPCEMAVRGVVAAASCSAVFAAFSFFLFAFSALRAALAVCSSLSCVLVSSPTCVSPSTSSPGGSLTFALVSCASSGMSISVA